MVAYRGDPLSLEAEAFRIEPVAVCYRGYSVSDVAAIGTTWAGITTYVPTIEDEDQSGVYRDVDTFYFADAGLYYASIQTVFGNGAASRYYAIRLQGPSGTNLQRLRHATASTSNVLDLAGIFRVSDNQATLQLCGGAGAGTIFSGATIDGEVGRTLTISFHRIGP